MITSVIAQASTELGIPLDLLLYLSGNPDALADISRAAAQTTRGMSPPQTPELDTSARDFPTELQQAFTKPPA
jgi:hypothetical protein